MRLGVVIPPTGRWAGLEQEFRWAEGVGYDVAYVYDHLTHPTVPGAWLAEGFSTLAAAASVTHAIDLGTLVASATLHSPVALARVAATVDDISGGRLVLGVGAGSPRCAAADRDEQPTPAQMADRFADVVEGLAAVLGGATSWRGRTYAFSGLETAPLPPDRGRPFLMLAAHGPRAIGLAAQHGDGWNTYGGPASVALEPDDYWRLLAEQVARMDRACADAGRDPAGQRRSLLLGYGRVRPVGSVAAYVEAAERAQATGFDELVVYGPHSPGAGFASDPAVHAEALSRLTA
ncbi:MAG TPA: LLM class flavin-dependent oxidoreductase [Marmoricola sp.]|jgi:alkanesulfonate monooxygenase SsuD/methylene tetrahydromethanopterin reductase-like flavin-dependent oxidoreductase (luciferase family)|nr:LLM class flavin-dependent oxidoreductase [Marmoricola sp.]